MSSVRSNKSITTVLSEQLNDLQFEDNPRNKTESEDSINLKSEVSKTFTDDRDAYGYKSEYDEHEENSFRSYEQGLEINKNKQFQWSRSILEEDAYPEKILTTDEAKKCLNRISQVGSGLVYAFIQIDANHRNLTNIEEIANFKYLSFINVSHNHLDLNALDVLRGLEYVVVIHADHNVVNSLCLAPMPYLQVLTLNSNRVSSLSGLKQPSLERLELNDNKISNLIQGLDENGDSYYCNETDCPNLFTLSLSRNALKTVEQFMLVSVNIRVLYLSYNKIDNLKGLENLPNLSFLHLRANQIMNLDGFTEKLKHLSYLNLRENRLCDFAELIKLKCLKSLKTLIVLQNNFFHQENASVFKIKILKLLPWLERINKETVSESEVNAAVAADEVSVSIPIEDEELEEEYEYE